MLRTVTRVQSTRHLMVTFFPSNARASSALPSTKMTGTSMDACDSLFAEVAGLRVGFVFIEVDHRLGAKVGVILKPFAGTKEHDAAFARIECIGLVFAVRVAFVDDLAGDAFRRGGCGAQAVWIPGMRGQVRDWLAVLVEQFAEVCLGDDDLVFLDHEPIAQILELLDEVVGQLLAAFGTGKA